MFFDDIKSGFGGVAIIHGPHRWLSEVLTGCIVDHPVRCIGGGTDAILPFA